MNTMKHIRKEVFAVSQYQFAEIAGVRQATVSKWESGQLEPDKVTMQRIRDAAVERGLNWNDSLFFEVPDDVSSNSEQEGVAQVA